MKKIVYRCPRDGVTIMRAFPGVRLACKVTRALGATLKSNPAPVENISRNRVFPASIEWAETEDEFIERIAREHVPVTITESPAAILAALARVYGIVHRDVSAAPLSMPRVDAVNLGLTFIDTPYKIVRAEIVPTNRAARSAWFDSLG